MLIPNIIGYHANSKKKCTWFLENNCLIESEDKHWLGNGMYFWDNVGNAHYWEKEKKRKQEFENILIVKATIVIDELLDLTDNEVIEKIDTLWTFFCKLKGQKKDIPIGERLNFLFEFCSDFSDKYKVIRAIGEYENHSLHSFLNSQAGRAFISSKVKTIYCVRCKSKIENKSKEIG